MRGKRTRKTERGGPRRYARKLAALDKAILVAGGLAVLVIAGSVLGTLNFNRVAPGEAKASAQLYTTPNCSCCEAYAAYLRSHGYAVTTAATHNLSLFKARARRA